MFGESDSESPRVPSPWDTLISTPPSPSPRLAVPKLVPEQDDGNVEYKLQLLSPSPARFARLVTQLKWRLLEGGGQAYYELGVADSGLLIGLPRTELEQTLETLEMMAGEIGASVIVVKEIEVPPAMAGLISSQTDALNGKRTRRQPLLIGSPSDGSTTNTETETELELSTTDAEEDDVHVLSTSPHVTSEPAGGLFIMDDLEFTATANGDPPGVYPPHYAIDLEISSVYKPRPFRAKSNASSPIPLKNKRAARVKKGKHLPESLSPPKVLGIEDQPKTKGQSRRAARDRKREERRRALIIQADAAVAPAPVLLDDDAKAACATDVVDSALVSGLESLHVSMEPVLAAEIPVPVPVLELNAQPLAGLDVSVIDPALDVSVIDPALVADDDEDDVFPTPTAVAQNSHAGDEPSRRLIVEALVVRKMSIEEAFLDFQGFSLT